MVDVCHRRQTVTLVKRMRDIYQHYFVESFCLFFALSKVLYQVVFANKTENYIPLPGTLKIF